MAVHVSHVGVATSLGLAVVRASVGRLLVPCLDISSSSDAVYPILLMQQLDQDVPHLRQ